MEEQQSQDYAQTLARLAEHSGMTREAVDAVVEREARLSRQTKERVASHLLALLLRVRAAVMDVPPTPEEQARLRLLRRDIAAQLLGLPLRESLSRRDIREGFHRTVTRLLGCSRRDGMVEYWRAACREPGEAGVRARQVLSTLEHARRWVEAHQYRSIGEPEWVLERVRAPLLRRVSVPDVLNWQEEMTIQIGEET